MDKQVPDDRVIYGIEAIADFIGAPKRHTQWLHETGQIPTFKMGKTVCLRVGAWREHVAKLERDAAASRNGGGAIRA